MAEEILIKYKVDITELQKAGAEVQEVTGLIKQQNTEITKTYANKAIDDAVQKLYEQGDVMGALIEKYGNAGKAVKAMQKELANMAALGKQNTKEYKELVAVTADLADTIGDTRNEINKMASDTRAFDTMVQGIKGVTAAMNVAVGLTATFGEQNEDLQKVLLKVQGAMATLQGVQELANIATEKGGIVTQAYGVALKGVEAISKTFGISMQASWALATGGITLAIGAIIGLISYLGDAEEETTQLTEAQRQNILELEKLEVQYLLVSGAIDDYTAKTRTLKLETGKSLEDIRQNTQKQLKDIQDSWIYHIPVFSSFMVSDYIDKSNKAVEEGKKQESEIMKMANARQAIIDAEERTRSEKALRDKLENERRLRAEYAIKQMKWEADMDQWLENELGISAAKGLERFKQAFDENAITDPLITDESVNLTELNAEREADLMAINIQQGVKNYKDAQKQQLLDQQEFKAAQTRIEQQYVSGIEALYSNMSSFISGIYQSQLAESEAAKQRELAQAGENATKRTEVEKKYAIEQAKIKRQQAIFEKSFALTQIAINLIQAVQSIQAEAAKLSSNPATAGLAANAYAQIGIAVASAAFQSAAVASKPLPEIPKFKKGGAVALAGGRISNGYIQGRSHRDGGVLIEAEGNEYIWHGEAMRRHGDIIQAAHQNKLEELVLHKYVVPALTKSAATQQLKQDTYDDFALRALVQQGHDKDRRNAEFIANKVASAVTSTVYNKTRYN